MHLLSVFSLRIRALIALVTIVVGVFGTIALTSLKQELIPSGSFPQLVVVTTYPGASPRGGQRGCQHPDRDRDPGCCRSLGHDRDIQNRCVEHLGIVRLRHESGDR